MVTGLQLWAETFLEARSFEEGGRQHYSGIEKLSDKAIA